MRNLLLVTLVVLGLALNAQSATVSNSQSVPFSGSSSGSVSGSVSITVSWSVSTTVSSSTSQSGSPTGTPAVTPTPTNSPTQSKPLSGSRSGSMSLSPSSQRVVAPGCDCDPAFDDCCFANCSSMVAGNLCGTQLTGAGDCYLGHQCTLKLECLPHYRGTGDKCTPTDSTKNDGICSSTHICFNNENTQKNPVKVGPALLNSIGKGKKGKKKLPKDVPFHFNGRRGRRNRNRRNRHRRNRRRNRR